MLMDIIIGVIGALIDVDHALEWRFLAGRADHDLRRHSRHSTIDCACKDDTGKFNGLDSARFLHWSGSVKLLEGIRHRIWSSAKILQRGSASMTKSCRMALTTSAVLAIVFAVLCLPSWAATPQAADQSGSPSQTKTKAKKAKKAKKDKQAKASNETQAGKAKASKKGKKASTASSTNSESTTAASGETTPESAAEPSTRNSRASAKSSETSSTAQTPPSAGMVWVNTDSGVYHKNGRWYGKTKHGKFMSEADAVKAGYRPAKRE